MPVTQALRTCRRADVQGYLCRCCMPIDRRWVIPGCKPPPPPAAPRESSPLRAHGENSFPLEVEQYVYTTHAAHFRPAAGPRFLLGAAARVASAGDREAMLLAKYLGSREGA